MRADHRLFQLAWLVISIDGQARPAHADPLPGRGETEIVRRLFRGGFLALGVNERGYAFLYHGGFHHKVHELHCDPLEGAWGLWVADFARDGETEVLVALRRPARFDPVVENRLHMYRIIDDQCVPAWRGSRLAGRFDRIGVRQGRLYAFERIGGGKRRIAEYRWSSFGFALRRVVWTGAGDPPTTLLHLIEEPK